MLTVANQVVLDIVVPNAIFAALLPLPTTWNHQLPVLSRRMSPMVGVQLSRPTRSETRRYIANRVATMNSMRSCTESSVAMISAVAPLQLCQRARGDVLGIALLVDGFLFHGAERIYLGKPLIDGVLEEAPADGKDLGHRALGHPVGAGGKGGHRFGSDLTLALGDGGSERTPFGIEV